MNWLARLFGAERFDPPIAARNSSPLQPIALAGDGSYSQEVVGESFYQSVLDAFCGGKCAEGHEQQCVVTLSPEPTNPHDENAVAVLLSGRKVAHLSRSEAISFLEEMARLGAPGAPGTCNAIINGGWRRPRQRGSDDEGHYGVELDLVWPFRKA